MGFRIFLSINVVAMPNLGVTELNLWMLGISMFNNKRGEHINSPLCCCSSVRIFRAYRWGNLFSAGPEEWQAAPVRLSLLLPQHQTSPYFSL